MIEQRPWIGDESSLERNKSHVVIPGEVAERGGDLSVVDESGNDYAFAADHFVVVTVPPAAGASLLKVASAYRVVSACHHL